MAEADQGRRSGGAMQDGGAAPTHLRPAKQSIFFIDGMLHRTKIICTTWSGPTVTIVHDRAIIVAAHFPAGGSDR